MMAMLNYGRIVANANKRPTRKAAKAAHCESEHIKKKIDLVVALAMVVSTL